MGNGNPVSITVVNESQSIIGQVLAMAMIPPGQPSLTCAVGLQAGASRTEAWTALGTTHPRAVRFNVGIPGVSLPACVLQPMPPRDILRATCRVCDDGAGNLSVVAEGVLDEGNNQTSVWVSP